MQRRVPALEKLERLTSFRPKTGLPEIVDRVAAYLEERKQKALAGAGREPATAAS